MNDYRCTCLACSVRDWAFCAYGNDRYVIGRHPGMDKFDPDKVPVGDRTGFNYIRFTEGKIAAVKDGLIVVINERTGEPVAVANWEGETWKKK